MLAPALEDRIDADLACGRHRSVVSELQALVAIHPLRERLWAQWVVALYRCGRQSEALRLPAPRCGAFSLRSSAST
jgi:DNA-binding SARP family transcriptional activator